MTHVIILAQGQQKRLPDLRGQPKQMLELPACDHEPIIFRTLCQLALLAMPTPCDISCGANCDGSNHYNDTVVTVVCDEPLRYAISASGKATPWKRTKRMMSVYPLTLKDPGNSSLKGIDRALRDLHIIGDDPFSAPTGNAKTVVLFGDAVYSWACLRACLNLTEKGARFVGTSDLSRSGGELWGLVWRAPAHLMMVESLRDALGKHPPFEDYQPGQMRRWLWETPSCEYVSIDDYTRDIDLPEHVAAIGKLAELANADDREHGLIWSAQ